MGFPGGSIYIVCVYIYQFSSVAQSCPTLCNPMDCSTPDFPVHHQLPNMNGQKNDTCKRRKKHKLTPVIIIPLSLNLQFSSVAQLC